LREQTRKGRKQGPVVVDPLANAVSPEDPHVQEGAPIIHRQRRCLDEGPKGARPDKTAVDPVDSREMEVDSISLASDRAFDERSDSRALLSSEIGKLRFPTVIR
jgi:hypothetical protein